ncbi:MAG: hypothetical protein N2449_02360 [Bacteroidales bacterium]|nr:hypothetical protein [Bacteroidales bacterium]
MKNIAVFFLVTSVVFISCKKDKDDENNTPAPTPLSILSSDFGNAGDTIVMNIDTTNLGGFSLAAGQNQIWDYSTISADSKDTIRLLLPSATPGSQYFSTTSNVAIQPADDPNVYLYLNKTTDKIEGIGLYANIQGTTIHPNFTDRPIMLKFPFGYNSNFKDSAYLTDIINFGVGQYGKLEIVQKYDVVCDGEGTIKLPNNKTYKVIREKRIEIQHAMIYMGFTSNGPWTLVQDNKDTTYVYNFYAKNKKWYLAAVGVDNFTNNTIKRIQFLNE